MKKNIKKYYSTAKEFTRFKRPHLFVRFCKATFKFFFPKTKVIFTEPLPKDEAIVICGNHAMEYAPMAYFSAYERKFRLWATANLCFPKKVANHVRYCFFPNAKGFTVVLCKIFTFFAIPILPSFFRGLEVIPSYQNISALITFDKTLETLNEGLDVIIFPETEVSSPDHKYVNKINVGFLRCAQMYYEQNGKVMKFYPAYACKELNTLVIGSPLTLDPNQSQRQQFSAFKVRIMDAIEDLAKSLPPHKSIPFNIAIEQPENLSKFIDSDKYSYKTKQPNKGKKINEND